VKVLICVVSYRTDEKLERYLDSILTAAQAAGSALTLNILVVDNSVREAAASEEFVRRISERTPGVEVICSETNLGYFGAVPVAQAAAARLRPEQVIFSNADLTLAPDFFIRLGEKLPCPAAVIAPAILIDEGRGFDQNPKLVERYSADRLRFLQKVYSSALLFALYVWLGRLKEMLVKDRPAVRPSGDRDIYAPHGALFLFTKLGFFLGLPRHEPFLYGEELFIAEEARRHAEVVRYIPAIRVFDSRHASTAGLGSARRRRLMKESIDFILRRYY